MIKKADIIEMAKLLRYDIPAFTALYDDAEEKAIEMPKDVQVFTTPELTSREETLKTRHEQAGMEIAVKNLKTEAGLEYDGKDQKKFLAEYSKKVLKDANIKESDKIVELNTTIEGLRTNVATLTTEKEQSVKTAAEATRDAEILSWTLDLKPDNLNNKEWLALIKMNNEIVDHEGVVAVKRDGKVVLNTTGDLKPIPAKDAIVSFIGERKLGKVVEDATKKVNGRNETDSKVALAGISNMKQFNDHLKTLNVNPNGDEAKKLLAEVTATNTNFDFSPEPKA